MAGISSVDCVGPAFSLMQKRLFQPFRFGYWSRIAVIGVLAGELSFNSRSCHSSGNPTSGGGMPTQKFPHTLPHGQISSWIAQHWSYILGGIAAAVIIALLFLYISSVMRFVLYEAVLRDKARIRQGFARWHQQGFDYFLFRLMVGIPYAALAVYLIGLPLFNVIKAGGGGPEIFHLMARLVGAILFVGFLGVLFAVAMVLTKDFVVPQMIFEQVSCTEAWGRLWRNIMDEPGSFIVYILLKIALAIGAFIVFAIMMIVAVIFLAIPVAIAIAAGVVVFKAVGGGIMAGAIAIAVGALIGAPFIIYITGFIGAPIATFFPAYSIYYFASRYRPLYDELYPQPSA